MDKELNNLNITKKNKRENNSKIWKEISLKGIMFIFSSPNQEHLEESFCSWA